MVLAQLVHLPALFNQLGPQLVFNDDVFHNLLPQLVQNVSQVASAQVQQLSKLVLPSCAISFLLVVELVEHLLREHLNLALVLNLLLFLSLFQAHNLLLLHLDFCLLLSHLFDLLL